MLAERGLPYAKVVREGPPMQILGGRNMTKEVFGC